MKTSANIDHTRLYLFIYLLNTQPLSPIISTYHMIFRKWTIYAQLLRLVESYEDKNSWRIYSVNINCIARARRSFFASEFIDNRMRSRIAAIRINMIRIELI